MLCFNPKVEHIKGKTGPFTNSAGISEYSEADSAGISEYSQSDPYLTPHRKMNSKWITDYTAW